MSIPQRVPLVDLRTGLIAREWINALTAVSQGTGTTTDLSGINAAIASLQAQALAQSGRVAALELGYQS